MRSFAGRGGSWRAHADAHARSSICDDGGRAARTRYRMYAHRGTQGHDMIVLRVEACI